MGRYWFYLFYRIRACSQAGSFPRSHTLSAPSVLKRKVLFFLQSGEAVKAMEGARCPAAADTTQFFTNLINRIQSLSFLSAWLGQFFVIAIRSYRFDDICLASPWINYIRTGAGAGFFGPKPGSCMQDIPHSDPDVVTRSDNQSGDPVVVIHQGDSPGPECIDPLIGICNFADARGNAVKFSCGRLVNGSVAPTADPLTYSGPVTCLLNTAELPAARL